MVASSKPHRWTYDVFVSFRGEDIRKSFVDHLLNDFEQKGISAFRDCNNMHLGEEISPELYKAIEQSRFLIVIFSKDYASSSWCLRELAKILECKEMAEPKYEVRIIFYDVKPDVVRKQTESYAKAFEKHLVSNKTEVATWKEALFKATNLSGWDLEDLTNGYEAKFIANISRDILYRSLDAPLLVGEKLVGVDAHVKKLNWLRFVGSNKVHMFGICGFSGLGKTTLAKAIYNSMSTYFEGHSFCEDVEGVLQRQGPTQVQMQLIYDIMGTRDTKIRTSADGIKIITQRLSSKRVLLVLDNVNHRDQVKEVADSLNWLFPGSLVIFTSKEIQFLRSYNVKIYKMPVLPSHEAFELFCLHAFGQKHATDHYFSELAEQVVKHLQGHPLALEVIGRHLLEKPVNIWKSELDRLQTYPNAEIQQKIRPTYDGLDFDQKRIFLDIAYSLIGENKDFAANVLRSHDCFPDTNMEVLVDKSLIKISPVDMSIQMHELIRSMAREIEREESNMFVNRRRLLGQSHEIYLVLSENKATEAVEVINLCTKISGQKYDINNDVFGSMKKLRILKMPKNLNVNFFGRLGYLSNNLRYLCWHGCPFKFLPSNFYPENIFAIDLSYSCIKSLWTTPKVFTRLEILKLSHCLNLINTPDFKHMTNLKELIMEGCVSLVEVHPSIGMLKSLVVLNMKNCKRLKSFPCKLEMDSLEILSLSGCLRVDNLPLGLGGMKRLLELRIDRTAITRLPLFVSSLTNLLVSSFGQHERIWSRWWTTVSQPSCLPQSLVLSSLASLCLLRSLILSWCNILQVPENIGGLSCLEALDLRGNIFTSLPESLSQLSHLRILAINYCKKLEVFPKLPPNIVICDASYCNISEVPENIGGLSRLSNLNLSENSFTSLPESFSELSSLYELDISGCKKLEVFPELNDSLVYLHASGCPKFLGSNFRIESEESQPWNTCMTSSGPGDKLSPLLRYLDIQSSIFEFFNEAESSYQSKEVDMTFHGNRIPEWFPNQYIGSDIKVEIPPDLCYNKFKGFAICVVFTPKKYFVGSLNLYVNNSDGSFLDSSYSGVYVNNIDSDMIWLGYRKSNNWRWEEAKDFVTIAIRGGGGDINEDDGSVEVKKIGVRLVYDAAGEGEDEEDMMDSSFIKHYLSTTTQHHGNGTFTTQSFNGGRQFKYITW